MQLIKEATEEKLRGGYYTPDIIASFILKWAFNGNKQLDILEPSCGDGVFLEEIKKAKYEFASLTAVELDKKEAKKSNAIGLGNTKVINADFHNYCMTTGKRFDLVVGNPPYIRYQYFNRDQQQYAASIFNKANLKYSKLTNAWVSFVVGSSLLLKEQGKIGFVLPAEILQVSYATPLREFLASFYNKINIISFEKLVFPDIQQEVVLLLCEKNDTNTHLIEHIELKDASLLADVDISALKAPRKKIDFSGNKWTFYFLQQKEIDFLERVQKDGEISKLGSYANVEVGITTGANPFFTVPASVVDEYDLGNYAKPLVGRSVQVQSVIFTQEDWVENRVNGARTHLLEFPLKKDLNGSFGARQYITLGEELKINEGYKCRIREEWQIIPSLRISEALFIRRNNLYPRFIINEAQAYTTDTMHRVTPAHGVDLSALTASYYNSLSLAFAEICGRSHGGGVLELMPNEVENILLPYKQDNVEMLPLIDRMMRDKKDISHILEVTNKKILQDNFGFSKSDISLADSIRQKLSRRRLNRGKK